MRLTLVLTPGATLSHARNFTASRSGPAFLPERVTAVAAEIKTCGGSNVRSSKHGTSATMRLRRMQRELDEPAENIRQFSISLIPSGPPLRDSIRCSLPCHA